MGEPGRIAIGIDVGGSGIKGAAVDVTTGALAGTRYRVPTPQPSTPQACIAVIARMVRRIVRELPQATDAPVGVGFPAVVLDGVTKSAANVDTGWLDFDADRALRRTLKRDAWMVNDADAAGAAEMKFGAGVGRRGTVILLTLGTGVGSAIYVDGRLVPNTELGHMEIRGRDAERRSSAAARTRRGLSWKAWAEDLDEHLLAINKLFSPNLFIVGGGVSKRFDQFAPRLTVPVDIVAAAMRNEAGIVGAALVAVERAERQAAEKAEAGAPEPAAKSTRVAGVAPKASAKHHGEPATEPPASDELPPATEAPGSPAAMSEPSEETESLPETAEVPGQVEEIAEPPERPEQTAATPEAAAAETPEAPPAATEDSIASAVAAPEGQYAEAATVGGDAAGTGTEEPQEVPPLEPPGTEPLEIPEPPEVPDVEPPGTEPLEIPEPPEVADAAPGEAAVSPPPMPFSPPRPSPAPSISFARAPFARPSFAPPTMPAVEPPQRVEPPTPPTMPAVEAPTPLVEAPTPFEPHPALPAQPPTSSGPTGPSDPLGAGAPPLESPATTEPSTPAEPTSTDDQPREGDA